MKEQMAGDIATCNLKLNKSLKKHDNIMNESVASRHAKFHCFHFLAENSTARCFKKSE